MILKRTTQQKGKAQRASVSAEVYGAFNTKKDFVPKVIAKTSQQRERIISRVTQSFLFNSLEDKDLNAVIDAMVEKEFKEGDAVITQGENGDVLYLIEKGELNCFKTFVYLIFNYRHQSKEKSF